MNLPPVRRGSRHRTCRQHFFLVHPRPPGVLHGLYKCRSMSRSASPSYHDPASNSRMNTLVRNLSPLGSSDLDFVLEVAEERSVQTDHSGRLRGLGLLDPGIAPRGL